MARFFQIAQFQTIDQNKNSNKNIAEMNEPNRETTNSIYSNTIAYIQRVHTNEAGMQTRITVDPNSLLVCLAQKNKTGTMQSCVKTR